MQKKLLIFLFLFPFIKAFPQHQLLPLNRQSNLWLERQLSVPGLYVHTSMKPLQAACLPLDSLSEIEEHNSVKLEGNSWIFRKLRKENLLIIDSGIFHATLDPVFDLEYMHDFTSGAHPFLYRNTRGFTVSGYIGRMLSFGTSFYENQAVFPAYLREFIDSLSIVPGQGRAKPFHTDGADFAFAEGYLSFQPFKSLHILFGNGKLFIGEGYRSLLLSDNAFSYPCLRLDMRFARGRLQYSAIYAWFRSTDRIPEASTPEALFQPKSGSFHYFSAFPFKWLQLGLFEGMIWQRWDSSGSKPPQLIYTNPLPAINTAMYGLTDANNALIGTNFRINPLRKIVFYGQIAMDAADKTALQAGCKVFDLMLKGLNIQLEYNTAQQGMYAHQIRLQSYRHTAEFLTHPYGGNFNELISFIDLKIRDVILTHKLVTARVNEREGNLIYQDINIAFELNRITHLKLTGGLVNRLFRHNNGITNPDTDRYFYIGLKTDLYNQYFDF